MGHGKETPRQKMIGMMYLVLTAMLALNVSADILNGFVLVNKGLVKTTENFVAKNEGSYSQFIAAFEKTPDKVKPFRDKAFSVKDMADQLAFDLQELKVEIVQYCDGKDAPSLSPVDWYIGERREKKSTFNIDDAEIKAKDNLDKAAEIMIVKGKGADLKKKIETYREHLLSLVTDDDVKKGINESLNTDKMKDKNGTEMEWENGLFEHIPMVAVLTMLSKLQSDVRNSEADVIRYLLSQIGASDTKVNKMEAIVQPLTPSYILKGGEYQARILLAAYDSLQKPEIFLGQYQKTANGGYEIPGGGRKLEYDAKGRAIFKVSGTSVGPSKMPGLLQMVTPEGTVSHPFLIEYQVGESQTVISATKMNVMYIGVQNPISVSMSGVPSEKIQFSISQGKFTKSGNEYLVEPATPGSLTVKVVGTTVDGKTLPPGEMLFRVKNVPTPVAKVGGKSSGNIDKNVLQGQQGVLAELEDFLFDLRFGVTGFTMRVITKDGERSEASSSAQFTEKQKALINGLTKGQVVMFTDIKARSTTGVTKDLIDISLRIN